MELLFIFCIGWVASHAFGEKRDEYEHSQDAHREKYMQRLKDKHPNWSKARQARSLQNAARRNALGHFAYLLRHGWSSTFNDFAHGWKQAQTAHEEWKAEHPKDDKKPSLWATFKAGIQKERATRYVEATKNANTDKTPPTPTRPPEATEPPNERKVDAFKLAAKERELEDMVSAYEGLRGDGLISPEDEAEHMESRRRLQAEIDELRRATGTPVTPWLTDEEARDARIYPWPTGKPAPANPTPGNTAGSTNGVPVTTTITAGEASSIEDVRQNSAAFTNTLAQVHTAADQLLADTLRFASKDTESLARIQRGIEALNNAIAEFGGMPASLQKHITGEEYAQSAHSVDDINALRTS